MALDRYWSPHLKTWEARIFLTLTTSILKFGLKGNNTQQENIVVEQSLANWKGPLFTKYNFYEEFSHG